MDEQETHVCTEDCTHETDIDFVAPKVTTKVKAPVVKAAQALELKVEDIIAHVEANAHKFSSEEYGRIRSLIERL